jgi:hypothetical protein
MKKFILAITISLGLICPAAFANDDSVSAHLATTLSMLFKITDNKNLLNANAYHQTTIVYQGMPIVAFKSNTSNWVGFFKKVSADRLPENAQVTIGRKYNDCRIKEVSMYINTDGDISYFAEITRNNKCTVLKIEPTGHVHEFNCRIARKMK